MSSSGDKRGTQARPPPPPHDHGLAPTQIGEKLQRVAAGAPLPAGVTVGEYCIEGEIGEGGMATVYSAVHPLIGKKVAIKVMSQALSADATAVERFVQEARAVNQIGHPNIVDIFAFGKLPDGRSYFVMEWLQGATLHARLASGKLPLAEAVEILFHVCDALEAAHEKGIVHRDLKPENIFLVERRGGRKQVKLLDFGIAKLTSDGGAGKVLSTNANVVMGTPQYISPEQARAKNIDHRTDIYSLGAMAYEMLLGRPPFISDSAMAMVAMHLSDPVPPPRTLWAEVPTPVEIMLLGMLDKDPDKRPSLGRIREYLADVREQFLPRLNTVDSGPLPIPTLLYGESQPIARVSLEPPYKTPPSGATPSPPATPPPTPRPTPAAGALEDDGEEIALVPLAERRRWILVGGAIMLSLVVVIAVLRSSSKVTAAPAQPAVAAAPAVVPPPAPAPAPAPTEKPVAPGVVTVNTNVADARIELDGAVVAASARTVRVEVARAGEHELVVTAAGKKPFKKRFVTSPGAVVEVPVSLRSASTSASRPAKAKTKNDNGYYMLDPLGTTQVR